LDYVELGYSMCLIYSELKHFKTNLVF